MRKHFGNNNLKKSINIIKLQIKIMYTYVFK